MLGCTSEIVRTDTDTDTRILETAISSHNNKIHGTACLIIDIDTG